MVKKGAKDRQKEKMVTKTIVFLYYRAGSSTFRSLCDERSRFLPTLPRKQCPVKYVPPGEVAKEIEVLQDRPFIVFTHIGDWWGQKLSEEVPDPYEDTSEMKWSMEELYNLPKANWKFYSLIRDGRNQIESIRCMEGGIEEKRRQANSFDYFKTLCLGFRNRARIALDCQKEFCNYKILRFENMINDPVAFMVSFITDVGFSPDMEFLTHRGAEIRRVGPASHSSFYGDLRVNERWRRWTPEEVDYFNVVAKREMIELGYMK